MKIYYSHPQSDQNLIYILALYLLPEVALILGLLCYQKFFYRVSLPINKKRILRLLLVKGLTIFRDSS